MDTGTWWSVVAGAAIALLVCWLALAVTLVAVRPRGPLLREAVRLLPDLIRLLSRLARDRTLPTGLRVQLYLLLAYLALPIDLIPDFIPVIGYADDAILAAFVLRRVVRQAGMISVFRHWPGTDDGFAALCRLTGIE